MGTHVLRNISSKELLTIIYIKWVFLFLRAKLLQYVEVGGSGSYWKSGEESNRSSTLSLNLMKESHF